MNKAAAAAKMVVYEEIQALRIVLESMDWAMFDKWVAIIAVGDFKVVVTGVGKSAIAARKVAATLATSGVQAVFLDPVGMFHGELGILRSGDVLIMISRSGETEELIRLIPSLEQKDVMIMPLVGVADSTLGRRSGALSTGVDKDPFMVPTASSAAAVAVGDALAAAIAERIGSSLKDNHPGGALGIQLTAGIK